jgi:hypothetical protein
MSSSLPTMWFLPCAKRGGGGPRSGGRGKRVTGPLRPFGAPPPRFAQGRNNMEAHDGSD